jgi:pectate lyase
LDVQPQTFGASGAWAGVLFRYVDAAHHYALALRDGTTLELRRIADNVTTTLATAPAVVPPGTVCALRLNAVGNSFKVYRNGALVLQATDDAFATGKVALATSSAAADFDDVVVVGP